MHTSYSRKHSVHGTKYHSTDDGPRYKICPKCKNEKLVKEFYEDTSGKTVICKACKRGDINARYARRKETTVIEHGNGEGRIDFADGAVYIGEMKDGKRHGSGAYFFPDGRQVNGVWDNGILQLGRKVDKNG